MAGLTHAEIMSALATMQHWGFESGELSRRFRFRDFTDAFGFVAQAAALQHEAKHYGRVIHEGPIVMIDLWSDVDGPINEVDIDLARKLSERASRAL
ncbi:MAG: 4a-hydroxytetrahydrobiopterin dehydratase [Chloroflexi bacterium]|nr:MAG: 4a-hydroxytetrahydrobiopterin dehydratase [Chloroflexota bacterium]